MFARYFVGLGLAACLTAGMLGCHSYRDQYGDDGRYRATSDCRARTAADCDRYDDVRERAERQRASDGGTSPYGR